MALITYVTRVQFDFGALSLLAEELELAGIRRTVLGGTATLLTTSNIVIGSILRDNNVQGFSLTDFAPVGIPIILVGIAYVAFIGRKFLPGESIIEKTLAPNRDQRKDLISAYNLGENLFRETAASGAAIVGTPDEEGFAYIQQNYLESSNVDPVKEITDLISAQRAYEMNSKIIQAADEMAAVVSKNLR